MVSASRVARAVVAVLACVGMTMGCSSTVSGTARVQPGPDATAQTVAPADLDKLLLSDAQITDLFGAAVVTFERYPDITPPRGETFSDPSSAEAVFNTMWTTYDGSGYTGAAGHKLGEPGTPAHVIDQGVVSFPSADAAARFVVHTVLGWDRCAGTHFSALAPPPKPATESFTVGSPHTSGDISTMVDSVDGSQGLTYARAITSRSNVVIDAMAAGADITTDKAVAVVNAITTKMPH
jgi:hypothetical protein